jgi:hypothetical protein
MSCVQTIIDLMIHLGFLRWASQVVERGSLIVKKKIRIDLSTWSRISDFFDANIKE